MTVFDCEADSLWPTKFHVLSYHDGTNIVSLHTHEAMREWLLSQRVLVGHNINSWDIPQLERVLKIKITARIIDTLWLSWYLYPERQLHGLEWWGRDFGVPKPKINDWENLTQEEYTHRCVEDVKINIKLWKKQKDYLSKLYLSDTPENLPIVHYLMFKASCAKEQERSKWRLDRVWCQEAFDRLSALQAPKVEALKLVMPVVKKQKLQQPPAKPFKKDGTPSVEGVKWKKYCREQGLTPEHSTPIYIVVREEPPNPNSPEQIKDWLFGLGWEPMTFKFVKEEDGSERKIPQVKIPQSPDICPSVLELAETEPAVLELAGLSVLKHRIGILKGFLENVDDEGFLKARVQGLTNTLRVRHTEVVNLPGIDKPYGEEIRGCLIARDGCELVGSDMSSLENRTGDHLIFDLDPEYVVEKNIPDYDPHLSMCVVAGMLTPAEVEFYKWYQKSN